MIPLTQSAISDLRISENFGPTSFRIRSIQPFCGVVVTQDQRMVLLDVHLPTDGPVGIDQSSVCF